MSINWRNFVWHDDEEKVNPFVHVFMFINFVFGLCFTFFPGVSGANHTFLYELTAIQTQASTTSVWGVCALIACVFLLLAFNYRKKWLGNFSVMFGFSVWLFALITYIIGGFWFGMLVAAVPNVFFWAWLYFTVGRYHRKHG
jgi:hypothetical protein